MEKEIYRLQADTHNGIYEVKEFEVDPMDLDVFIYECDDVFEGIIAVEVGPLELKGLEQEYGVTRL